MLSGGRLYHFFNYIREFCRAGQFVSNHVKSIYLSLMDGDMMSTLERKSYDNI